MAGSSTQLAKNLHALQRDYLARLEKCVADFERFAGRLREGTLAPDDFQILYRLSHNFAGSGATFGFSAISDSAAALHQKLSAFPSAQDQSQSDAKAGAGLSESLGNFILACRQALTSQPQAKPESTLSPPPPVAAMFPQETLTIGVRKTSAEQAPELAEKLLHFGYKVTLWLEGETMPPCNDVHIWLACSDLQDSEKQKIRALAKPREGASCPLIVLSTCNDFETRLAAVRCGAQGFFLETDDVLRIIERIERLAGKQSAPEGSRVLIVDDDEILAQHYKNTLKDAGMEVMIASSPEHALGALSDQMVDLVLLDFSMPDCNGQELASVIRQHTQYVSLPIVFMSAKEDIEAQLRDTGLGIDDFLIKPIAGERLVSVVRSRADRSAELRSLMVRDSFTGLLSHAYFLEKLETELLRIRRDGGETSYAMLDLDHFKRVNDTYGHAAGDQVIKSLSRMLQQRLRRSDIIGRCGGEEFGILMPNCPKENARIVLESLREAFKQSVTRVSGKDIHITLSGGLVRVDPALSLDQIINATDEALYKAKHEGRDRLIVA